MANKMYEESDIQAIADAIRFAEGDESETKYKVSEMAGEIRNNLQKSGLIATEFDLTFSECTIT